MRNNFSVLNILPIQYIFPIKTDKKPYSGDFQSKKGYFGKKWPKIDQNCEKRGDFIITSTVFLQNGQFLLIRYPYDFEIVSTDFEKYP